MDGSLDDLDKMAAQALESAKETVAMVAPVRSSANPIERRLIDGLEKISDMASAVATMQMESGRRIEALEGILEAYRAEMEEQTEQVVSAARRMEALSDGIKAAANDAAVDYTGAYGEGLDRLSAQADALAGRMADLENTIAAQELDVGKKYEAAVQKAVGRLGMASLVSTAFIVIFASVGAIVAGCGAWFAVQAVPAIKDFFIEHGGEVAFWSFVTVTGTVWALLAQARRR